MAVGVFQLWLPGIASQALVKLQPIDPAPWLRGLGGWLTGNKDELTTIAAGIGVVIAILALFVNARAEQRVADATRLATWNSTRDVLWRFNEQWNQLYESRKKAVQILKTMPPYAYDTDLAQVLNHFEAMAFYANRGHLDDEMAWTNYFDEAADLWNRAMGYINWRREAMDDWTLYGEYEMWVHRVAKMDARRRELAKRQRQHPSSVASVPMTENTNAQKASKDKS